MGETYNVIPCPKCGGTAVKHCNGQNDSHICDLVRCLRGKCGVIATRDGKRVSNG